MVRVKKQCYGYVNKRCLNLIKIAVDGTCKISFPVPQLASAAFFVCKTKI